MRRAALRGKLKKNCFEGKETGKGKKRVEKREDRTVRTKAAKGGVRGDKKKKKGTQ